ncbi:MAG: serine hydrolase [Alphaproteobacteria bacterium]|nr:serine hydrolase [Alphaproteobacteria bacterium]
MLFSRPTRGRAARLHDIESFPQQAWQRTDPAADGWSMMRLGEAEAHGNAVGTAAVVVVSGGRMIHAWGPIEHPYMCHSIRKSLLSALYGIYEAEGRIDLYKTLDELGIDDRLGLNAREKKATVYDLLLARSGIYHPTGFESDGMKLIREERGSHGPGTFWVYNNWDFNALGTIFEQVTGHGIFDAFRERIAIPCGFEDFRYDETRRDGEYVELTDTVHPAFPFRLSARDLARFGLLYLRHGRWGGRQIVPDKWVKLSVLPYSDAGARGAYGYMWWVERHGIHFPGTIMPAGTYSARGVGGHVLMVVPALDLVIAHRVDTDIKGKEVPAHQVGRLFELILSART